jgi:hypothetical protein
MKAFNLLNLVKVGVVLFAALMPLATVASVTIESKNFPDPKFRAFVKQYDTNSDGTLSDAELSAVNTMDASRKSIKSLFGIQFFTSLRELDVSYNKIGDLNLSKNPYIRKVTCHHNKFGQTGMRNLLKNLPYANVPYPFNNNLITPGYLYFKYDDETEKKGGNTVSWDYNTTNIKYWFGCQYSQSSNAWVNLTNNNTPAVTVDETNFPDPAFRSFIKSKYGSSISYNTIDGITSLDLGGKGIKNLKGIEWFTALRVLNCSDNELRSLDFSYNAYLYWVWCFKNRIFGKEMDKLIESLPVLAWTPDWDEPAVLFPFQDKTAEGNTLSLSQVNTLIDNYWQPYVTQTQPITQEIPLYINPKTFPDEAFRSFIKSLVFGEDGKITAAEIANITYLEINNRGNYQNLIGIDYLSELRTLFIQDAPKLTSVDLSRNTKLTSLYCNRNYKLTELDLTNNNSLVNIDCSDNSLQQLYLPISNINNLYIMRNKFSPESMITIAAALIRNYQNLSAVYIYPNPQVFVYDNTTGKEGNEFNLNNLNTFYSTRSQVYHTFNYIPSASPEHSTQLDKYFQYNSNNQLFFDNNYIQGFGGNSGTTFTLPLTLNNESAKNVKGLTFDLSLPDGVTLADVTPVQSRLSGHTVSYTRDATYPNTYHVTVSTGSPFVGTSGTILNLKLNLMKSLQGIVRLHNVVLKATVSGSSTVENLKAGPFTTRISVTNGNQMLGDVNNSRNITPADAIMVLYHYFNVEQTGFNLDNADMNNDNSITPADAIEVLYKYFDASGARATKPATTTATEDMDPE